MFVSTCHISLCLVAKSAKYTYLIVLNVLWTHPSGCSLLVPLHMWHVSCDCFLPPARKWIINQTVTIPAFNAKSVAYFIFLIWAIFWLQCNGLHVCNLWNRRHRLVRQWNCEFLMESKSFTFILLIKAPTITIHQMIHPVTKPKYVLLAWLMIMFEANSNWMLWRQQAVRFRGVVLNVDTELCGFN